MDKLNKLEIIELVAEKGSLSKKDAKEAVEITFDLIEKALLKGQEVNISNFGVFTPKVRKSRIGTDPATHKQIQIKERNTISFRMSKALKAKIK